MKRKLPSKKQVYSSAKKTVSKPKSSVKKVTSKTKNVITTGKKKLTPFKSSINKKHIGGKKFMNGKEGEEQLAKMFKGTPQKR